MRFLYSILFCFSITAVHAKLPYYENILDTACNVLYAQAAMANAAKKGLKNQVRKIYEEDITKAHQKWRSLWVKATAIERQVYGKLLKALNETRKINAWFMDKKVSKTITKNIKTADNFLSAWEKKTKTAKKGKLKESALNAQLNKPYTFNYAKTLEANDSITLKHTDYPTIEFKNPLQYEFLKGLTAEFKNNADLAKQNIEWGYEQYAIMDQKKEVGLVGISIYGKKAIITPMYLYALYQGQGYGYYATLQLIKKLRKKGITLIRGIVDVLNLPSMILRESLGFAVDTTHDDFGIDGYPHLFPAFVYELKL